MHPTSNAFSTSPPADILWLIVDALVADIDFNLNSPKARAFSWSRRWAMCNCALVCKGMSHRANYHLYSAVILTEPRQFSSFARTMAERGDLALMVKHLTLETRAFLSEEEKRFDVPLPPPVIARLSSLQSLELDGGSELPVMPPAALDYVKLFAKGSSVLEDLSLTDFWFSSYADFVGLVWSFPHIRQVTINGLNVDQRRVRRYRPNMSEVDRLRVTRLPTEPRRFSNLTSLVRSLRLSLWYDVDVRRSRMDHSHWLSRTWICLHVCGARM